MSSFSGFTNPPCSMCTTFRKPSAKQAGKGSKVKRGLQKAEGSTGTPPLVCFNTQRCHLSNRSQPPPKKRDVEHKTPLSPNPFLLLSAQGSRGKAETAGTEGRRRAEISLPAPHLQPWVCRSTPSIQHTPPSQPWSSPVLFMGGGGTFLRASSSQKREDVLNLPSSNFKPFPLSMS